MSYKESGLTESEFVECQTLDEIFQAVKRDIIGEKLYHRRNDLRMKARGDITIIYCPYIPLQTLIINNNVA